VERRRQAASGEEAEEPLRVAHVAARGEAATAAASAGACERGSSPRPPAVEREPLVQFSSTYSAQVVLWRAKGRKRPAIGLDAARGHLSRRSGDGQRAVLVALNHQMSDEKVVRLCVWMACLMLRHLNLLISDRRHRADNFARLPTAAACTHNPVAEASCEPHITRISEPSKEIARRDVAISSESTFGSVEQRLVNAPCAPECRPARLARPY
jgi:hypothetical protein